MLDLYLPDGKERDLTVAKTELGKFSARTGLEVVGPLEASITAKRFTNLHQHGNPLLYDEEYIHPRRISRRAKSRKLSAYGDLLQSAPFVGNRL